MQPLEAIKVTYRACFSSCKFRKGVFQWGAIYLVVSFNKVLKLQAQMSITSTIKVVFSLPILLISLLLEN